MSVVMVRGSRGSDRVLLCIIDEEERRSRMFTRHGVEWSGYEVTVVHRVKPFR